MPPFIAAVLIGAGAYAGFQAARRLWTALSEADAPPATDAAEARPLAEKNLGALERDPATGIYRPVRRPDLEA
ncbi:MAG: hypothetical protein AB7O57_00290 [Hyphomicrobiaceae bacterium]